MKVVTSHIFLAMKFPIYPRAKMFSLYLREQQKFSQKYRVAAFFSRSTAWGKQRNFHCHPSKESKQNRIGGRIMRDFALIFRHAWELARKGAETFGGSARSYFRESLLLAYDQLKRNVTAKDLVKIMTGRYMSMSQIREEVNARFKKQTAKNIARRIWNMFRSPYVEIEKIKCESTGKYLYHLKHAQKNFFVSGAITRALKSVRPEKKKAIKPRPAMSRDEINSCRMANAFHKALSTGIYIPPNLI